MQLPQAEFAYNNSINQTIGCSPFEVIHKNNPMVPLDLVPISNEDKLSGDANKKANQMKLHENVWARILQQNNKYFVQANQLHKFVAFK